MTFVDAKLESFYHFAKLLLKQLPLKKQTLPREIVDMIDMDKYRVQEEQNGNITLEKKDGVLEPGSGDGHDGNGKKKKEKLIAIVEKLNKDYGIEFEEADRVVHAIKRKLEEDQALKAVFQASNIESLLRDKLNRSIQSAFLSNADAFLNFMAKTETDTAFGNFFSSEMFKWYSGMVREARGGA